MAKCVEGAVDADCEAAKVEYARVQAAATALRDKQMGTDGTVPVIMMENSNPSDPPGRYSFEHHSVILYPDRDAGVTAHEIAHVYVHKHLGENAEIEFRGVDEGFAKIVAHHVTGRTPLDPSADNVADILDGPNCTIPDSGCAHDLGNLVFDAYEEIVEDWDADFAFKVYLAALGRLKGREVTPATLHMEVSQVLLEYIVPLPPVSIYAPPPYPDPFALLDWLWALWWRGIPIIIFD